MRSSITDRVSAAGTRSTTPTIIDPTDVVVRIDTATICCTDLHILKGDVPETVPGTILGHEAVGTIQEIGRAATASVRAAADGSSDT
jgi:D-arabinose 1-dehydrogenase-like Zn-dependent alcohol dehydrogenase